MHTRKPVQLLLAFYGDMVMDRLNGPIPAPLLLDVLSGAGVAPATTRATLNRLAHRGILTRVRKGRGIGYQLTDAGVEVLREAAGRVNRPRPFDAQGKGWTLVTFSVPEGQRTLRHRLRSTLTWAGFAPLRDGLWVAPGTVDLNSAMHRLQGSLPSGSLTAFLAHELEGFEMGASVRAAWDLEGIRALHHEFAQEWREPADNGGVTPALTTRTALVADWLALLRADPGLPHEYLDDAWPADDSTAIFRTRRRELETPSVKELETRLG